MALYNIYSGLGGSFGGVEYKYTSEFKDYYSAEQDAFQSACEDYESYEGLQGILDYEDVKEMYCEENNINSKDLKETDIEIINELYNYERENWIEYSAILTEEDSDISKEELNII